MRKYAFDIVYGTLEKNGHSDDLFHGILAEHKELSAQDKSFIKRLSYGAVERMLEADARLSLVSKIPVKKMSPVVRTILRMAVYEICYMDNIPSAVSCNEAVELTKQKKEGRYSAFVNGVLRNLVRSKDSFVPAGSWIQYSMPKELMKHLERQYGKKTAGKIASAFLQQQKGVTLHVDENKIATDKFLEILREDGINCERGYYMEQAVVLSQGAQVQNLPGYEEGWFFVQDESSMLPVLCAGIQPGNKVMDLCSAPGGKTVHALCCLGGKGQLIARDVSEEKVNLIRENVVRMGYPNVVCECRDARKPDKKNKGTADVVLADVPCSGIGIIGRKPEIKYRALNQIKTLLPLQREILDQAVELLKPNGTLIYSTCTINQAENEDNVQWMESELGLKRESLDEFLPELLTNRMTAQGMLQMLPGIHKSDGFFIARMRKVND